MDSLDTIYGPISYDLYHIQTVFIKSITMSCGDLNTTVSQFMSFNVEKLFEAGKNECRYRHVFRE